MSFGNKINKYLCIIIFNYFAVSTYYSIHAFMLKIKLQNNYSLCAVYPFESLRTRVWKDIGQLHYTTDTISTETAFTVDPCSKQSWLSAMSTFSEESVNTRGQNGQYHRKPLWHNRLFLIFNSGPIFQVNSNVSNNALTGYAIGMYPCFQKFFDFSKMPRVFKSAKYR